MSNIRVSFRGGLVGPSFVRRHDEPIPNYDVLIVGKDAWIDIDLEWGADDDDPPAPRILPDSVRFGLVGEKGGGSASYGFKFNTILEDDNTLWRGGLQVNTDSLRDSDTATLHWSPVLRGDSFIPIANLVLFKYDITSIADNFAIGDTAVAFYKKEKKAETWVSINAKPGVIKKYWPKPVLRFLDGNKTLSVVSKPREEGNIIKDKTNRNGKRLSILNCLSDEEVKMLSSGINLVVEILGVQIGMVVIGERRMKCFSFKKDDKESERKKFEWSVGEEDEEDQYEFSGLLNTNESFKKLSEMVGLGDLKNKIISYSNFAAFNGRRADNCLSDFNCPLHSLFLGDPGTGKTTVAKLLGKILCSAGVLSSGHVVVRDRSSLVGEYYGSAEKYITEALRAARGGILFIDEAYQLYVRNDPRDPGKEVIGALMTALADEEKRDWMLILAGYTKETLSILKLNPGLESRFPETNRFVFPSYSEDELLQIAKLYFQRHDLVLSPESESALIRRIHEDYSRRDKTFGNGRYVTNLIETQILPNMANRIADLKQVSVSDLQNIIVDDIPKASLLKDPNEGRLGFLPA